MVYLGIDDYEYCEKMKRESKGFVSIVASSNLARIIKKNIEEKEKKERKE